MSKTFLRIFILVALIAFGIQADAMNLECKRICNPVVLYSISDLSINGINSKWANNRKKNNHFILNRQNSPAAGLSGS